jgi:hypothetical protein
MNRFQGTFLALVTAQAAHSLEEYSGRLYEVFAPARFFSGLFSADLETGFIIANTTIVAFGFWCFLWPVHRRWRSANALAWFWVVLGLVNGIVHLMWSLSRLAYTPGVVTAVLLLVLAAYLARQLAIRGAARA